MIVLSDGREGNWNEESEGVSKPLSCLFQVITSRGLKVTFFQSYNIIKMPLKATHKFDLISLLIREGKETGMLMLGSRDRSNSRVAR